MNFLRDYTFNKQPRSRGRDAALRRPRPRSSGRFFPLRRSLPILLVLFGTGARLRAQTEPMHPILTISGSGSGASTVTNIAESAYTNDFIPHTPPRNSAQGFVPAVVSGDTGWSWSASAPNQITSTPSGIIFPNADSATYPVRTQAVSVFLTTATNNLTRTVNAIYYNKAGSTTSKSMVFNLIDYDKLVQLRNDFNKLAPAYINSGSTPSTRNDNYARRVGVALLDWARWHPSYYLTAINSPTYIDVTTNYLASTGGFGPQRASDHNGLAHEWQDDELLAFDAIYNSVALTNLSTEMGYDVRQYICDNLFFDEGDFLVNHIPVAIAIQSNLSGPYAVLPQVARVLNRPDYIIWMDSYLDATVRQKIRRDGALEEGEGYSIGYLNANQDAAQNTHDYFLTRAATNSLLLAISNRARLYNATFTYGQSQWNTISLPSGQLPAFGDTPYNNYFSSHSAGNSALLPAYGTVAMGAGSGSQAVQVNQNFSGDNNHMRADMNAFVLWAFNNEYLDNIRYYNGSIGRNFGEQMLAYNTITIDRSNLTPYPDADTYGNGDLTLYEPGNNGLAMTELDGQRGYSGKASRFQRLLLLNTVDLARPYVVDVFRVTGGATHDYTFHGAILWNQNWKCSFPLATNPAQYPMLEGTETWNPTTDTPYYGFWRNVSSGLAPGNFQITYSDTNRNLGRDIKLWMTADPNSFNVYLGTTPVPARDDTVPANFFNSLGLTRPSAIIRHRIASGTLQDLFVSVVEPMTAGVSNIVSVARLPMSGTTNESVGLKITFKDGRVDTYIVNLRNPQVAGATGGAATVSTLDGQYSLTGRVGLHVDRPTGDSRVLTMNATDFKFAGRELSTPTNTYFSGLIAGETRKLNGASNDAFTTASPLPLGTALRNKWLSFTHGALSGSGTTGISEMFRIDQVLLSNNLYYVCFTNDHCLEITNGTTSVEQVAPLRTFTTSNSFEIALSAYAQQISPIADQVISPGGSSGPLSFNFGNLGAAAGSSLAVLASSSNPSLVPNGNLALGGSGTNRTLTVTPLAGQTGSALITVSVSDGTWTNSRSFNVTVSQFALAASPSTQGVLVGASTNYMATVSATNGFNGTVNLAVSGVPAGVSAVFNPPTLLGAGSSTLNIVASNSVSPGSYPLVLTATSGSLASTDTVTLIVTNFVAAPGTLLWIGSSNWSTVLNWTNTTAGGNGPPGPSSDVLFDSTATVGASNTVDSIVDSDITIDALTFANTNGYHTLSIAPGKTLTVAGAGGVTVGTGTDLGTNATVKAAITGAGGTLVISNSNAAMLVRQYTAGASGGIQRAALDLSGLDNFVASAGSIQVGNYIVGGTARSAGTVFFARTNVLNLLARGQNVTTNAGIDIGDNPSANSSQFSYLYLGQDNTIHADGITVGGGRNIGWMGFNPAFANSSVFIRGTNGDASRVTRWLVGDNSGASGTGSNSRGTNDFNAGAVDALVDTMILGKGESPTMGTGNSTGVLAFTQGTIDVNTLQLGVQTPGATGGTNANLVGIMNVNGGTLMVNSNIAMGVFSNSGVSAQGVLNIDGGTVQAAGITNGGGSAIINIDSGTLDLRPASAAAGGRIVNVSALNVGAAGVTDAASLANAASISTTNILTVFANGTIAGNSIITSPQLVLNGAISPGASGVGAITNSGPITLGAGGRYVWDIQDGAAAPGKGSDFVGSGSGLDVQATAVNPFIVQVQSSGEVTPGNLPNFENTSSYSWIIASGSGLTNFSPAKFAVDSGNFADDLAGGYFFIAANGSSLTVNFTNNHPPSASDASYYVPPGGVLQIPLAALAAHWSDPDSDPVQFVGVAGDSANGTNNVSSDGTYLYYTNQAGGADTITYTVADVRTNPPAVYRPGDTVQTGVGLVQIQPPASITSLSVTGTNFSFGSSNGIPRANFSILESTNVTLPETGWSVIQTGSFDGNGILQFTNNFDPAAPQKFYQLRLQ
jgi:hypothetical protein